MLNMYIHFYAYIYISQFTNKIEVLQKKKKKKSFPITRIKK